MKRRDTALPWFMSCMSAFLLVPLFSLESQTVPDIVWSRQLHTKVVNSVAFSEDATLVASGSEDATIRVWNATNGEVVVTLPNAPVGILQIAFASNTSLASWD